MGEYKAGSRGSGADCRSGRRVGHLCSRRRDRFLFRCFCDTYGRGTFFVFCFVLFCFVSKLRERAGYLWFVG